MTILTHSSERILYPMRYTGLFCSKAETCLIKHTYLGILRIKINPQAAGSESLD